MEMGTEYHPRMFCPGCGAEYRPGFARCRDCNVELVHQRSESQVRPRVSKYDWAWMTPDSARAAFKDTRRTIRWWASYRRQTGIWPWFSIAAHFMNWVLIFCGIALLILWSGEYHLSQWQFFGIFWLVSVPYLILVVRTKKVLKLHYLRKQKHLAKQRRRPPAVV
jgi:hypothetical protein